MLFHECQMDKGQVPVPTATMITPISRVVGLALGRAILLLQRQSDTRRLRMNRATLIGLLASVAFSPGLAAAQVCLTDADTSSNYLALLRSDVHDTTDLSAIGLQAVPDTSIYLVTSDSVCTVARTANNTIRHSQWGASVPTRVYVLRVGPNRYIVIDPDASSAAIIFAVFNESWQFLASYAG